MKGIALVGKDKVAAMDVVPEDSEEEARLLIATRKGFGKLSLLRHYRQQKRAGKGLITLRLTRKNGNVAAAQVVMGEREVYLVTEQAQLINIPLGEIRQTGRNTQGVTLAKLESGDSVSAIRAVGTRRKPAATLDQPVAENGVDHENGVSDEADLEDTVAEVEETDVAEDDNDSEE